MDKYDIGGFAIWEKNDDGEAVIRYRDDNIKRLTVRNLDILNVIIEFSVKYDTFITAQEIADTLKANGKLDHDRDTVKHALNRIRKNKAWGSVIVSSPTGYLIKCEIIPDAPLDEVLGDSEEVPFVSEEIETNEIRNFVAPVPEPKAPIIDNEPAILLRTKAENYISNFIRDNSQIRTYFYKNTPRDVLQVMHPLTLRSDDELSFVDISFESLYKDNERHRYIVSGIVGSGKSLLARKIAIEAAKAYYDYKVIPILIDLFDFSDTEKSLYEIIQDEYESYIPEYNENSNNDITIYCQHGSILLLLDGLDALRPNVKDAFIHKLKAFMRSYSNNTIILFTRPTGSFVEFESFRVLELNRMIYDEPLNLTKDLLCLNSQEDIEVFKRYLDENNSITLFNSTLYGNPLFISIFCSNHKHYFNYENPKLHEDIESFIKYLTGEDTFVQHSRFTKFMLIPSELDYELRNFCVFLLLHDCNYFDDSVVYKCWEYFGEDVIKLKAGDFLDDLCREYGLIRFVDGKYEYIDDIIPTYYCAKEILSLGIKLQTIKEIFSETTAFSANNIMNLLFEMDSDSVSKNVYAPFFSDIVKPFGEAGYRKFLLYFYPTISYYVGDEGYSLKNERNNDLYKHIVKDWGIAQDINHLPLPPIESLKKSPVYYARYPDSVNSNMSAREIEQEAFMNRGSPVGYTYEFKMKDVLQSTERKYSELREILLSRDFPLHKEFEAALRISKDLI